MNTVIINKDDNSLSQYIVDYSKTRIIDDWLRNKTPSSIKSYKSSLREFSRFMGVGDDIEQAVRRLFALPRRHVHVVVIRFKDDMRTRGRSARTINHRLSALRSVTDLANSAGLADIRISIKNERAAAAEGVEGPGVEALARVFVAAAAQSDSFRATRDSAMLRLMFDLALRRSTVSNVDIQDVDLERLRIQISLKGRRGKTPYSLTAKSAAAIGKHLETRGAPKTGPLFVDSRGRLMRIAGSRISPNGITKIVNHLGKLVGVKLWPHGIRHTAITQAAVAANRMGVAIEELKAYSGHENIATLLIYRDNVRNVQGMMAEAVSETI